MLVFIKHAQIRNIVSSLDSPMNNAGPFLTLEVFYVRNIFAPASSSVVFFYKKRNG